MSDWIQLGDEDIKLLDIPHSAEAVDGIEIHVFMSPYDVPHAVRGDYDRAKDRFAIEFRYISDEPRIRRTADGPITLDVGKNSGRLYGIEIDVQALQVQAVGLRVHIPDEVVRTLEQYLEDPPEWLRPENYRAARQVISDKREQLFEPLATSS